MQSETRANGAKVLDPVELTLPHFVPKKWGNLRSRSIDIV